MAIEFKSPTVAKNTITDRLEKQGREAKLQEKSVEYTQNNDYQVLPDEGFDGMTKVNVSVDVAVPTIQNSKTVNINTNGTQTISPDNGYDVVEQVVVNTNVQPNLQEKTVNVLLSDTTTNIQPDSGFDGMSSVTVNHPPVESNTAYTATSNGSYTIHPSEGFDATTSVNLTVNVTNPPTAYDINDQRVRLGGTFDRNGGYIKQSDIDSLTGWDKLTVGYGKCPGVVPTENVVFNLPELTNARAMFYGPANGDDYKISFTDGSLSKLTEAAYFCSDDQNLWFDFSNIDLSNCISIGLGGATIQTDVPLKLGIERARFSNIKQKNDVLKFRFVREWNLGSNNDIDFGYNTNITNIELTFDYPYNPGTSMFINCFNLTNLRINGNIHPRDTNQYNSTFYNCRNIINLSITTISSTLYLNDCSNLSQESVNNVLNALADGVTGKSITFASTQYGYITEEQKAAATAKGWTIKSA